jgi:hypothetical protein
MPQDNIFHENRFNESFNTKNKTAAFFAAVLLQIIYYNVLEKSFLKKKYYQLLNRIPTV